MVLFEILNWKALHENEKKVKLSDQLFGKKVEVQIIAIKIHT